MYDSKKFVPKFFDRTSSSYDKVVAYCTFGKDKHWKNKIIKYIRDGNSFLDLACGTGILTRIIAKKFPKSSVVGVDITQGYLELAKKKSFACKNISYLLEDAETIDLLKKFDYITASYLPKYCDPAILVNRCILHLKPNGTIILHDFTYPQNYFVKAFWNMYFVVLNFIGCFIPPWKEAFANLPKLIKSSSWVATYEDEMKKNGFEVTRLTLTCGTSAILIAKRT